jgi:hypothetical protein
MLLISFSTSGPSPAHVTHLYSDEAAIADDGVDADDERLNVLQPAKANATAHANNELNNLLVIDALLSLTVSVTASDNF